MPAYDAPEMSNPPESLTFQQELTKLLNRHNVENGSGTPDFILSEYIRASLQAFELATTLRERWYGREQDSRFGTPLKSFLDDSGREEIFKNEPKVFKEGEGLFQ